MKINVKKFIDVIKKSTLNYINDYTQIVINKDSISCGLSNSTKTVIVKLNLDNEMITDIDEEIVLNLTDPGQSIIPFLTLFDAEEVNLKYDILRDDLVKTFKLKDPDSKISTKLNFSETVSTRLYKQQLNENTKYAFEVDIDEDFIDVYEKIKKISAKTGKIYFLVDDGKFYIEAGDKSLQFTNSVKIEMEETDEPNFTVCFDFKYLVSVLSVISLDEKNYKLKLAYRSKKINGVNKDIGILYIVDDNKSEEYFLASFSE